MPSDRIRPINSRYRPNRLLWCLTASLVCWSPSGASSDADVPLLRIALAKPPTSVAVSRDGRILYVGLDRHFGIAGGIATYRRDGNTFAKTAEVAVPEGVLGIAVTSDERTIVASTPIGLVSVAAFALQRNAPVVVSVRDGDAPGTNQLVISHDNRYVLYTDSQTATLGIARLDSSRSSLQKPELTIVGHVPLDRAPGGLVLSPDGRTVFVTSEIDNVDSTAVTGAGNLQLSRAHCETNLGPSGVLSMVSVAAAIEAPERAVMARTAAGCAPVRVALSPNGRVVWISDRGEARVLAFDVAHLKNGSAALLASVDVGSGPVGIALTADGRHALVANSNRTGPLEGGKAGTLSLLDTDAVMHGAAIRPTTLRAGSQPREVIAAPDGTFYVTDYNGRSIEVLTPGEVSASLSSRETATVEALGASQSRSRRRPNLCKRSCDGLGGPNRRGFIAKQ